MIKKSLPFAGRFASQTFVDNQNELVGQNGVISGGAVTTSAGVVTIQPLSFIQNGEITSSDQPLSTTVPSSLVAPYFVALSISSNVQNPADVLTPTFVKRPEDASANTVLIAEWDGTEWRSLPKLEVGEVLKAIRSQNIENGLTGISNGLDVTYSAGTIQVAAGALLDPQGYQITKQKPTSFAALSADADGFGRIDEVVFRRPDDSSTRVGMLSYLPGLAYDPSGADATLLVHNTPFGSNTKVNSAAKVLSVPATNLSVFLWIEDYGSRSMLKLMTAPDLMSSTSTPVVIAQNLTEFSAILNPDGSVDLVYVRGTSLYYQRVTTAGVVLFAESLIATDTLPLSNVRLVSIASGASYFLHIVYERAVNGSDHTLMYMRLSAQNTIETQPTLLVDLSAVVTNPSLSKDDDDALLLLAYENATTGRVYLRTYDASTPTGTTAPTQLGATLELEDDTLYQNTSGILPASGATEPVVVRGANKDTFVFWRQNKGAGNYGIAIYSPRFMSTYGHKAVLPDITGASENILDYRVAVDALSGAHFSLAVGLDVIKASLLIDSLTAIGTPTNVVPYASGTQFQLALNSRGALIHTSVPASSGWSNNGALDTIDFFGPGTFNGVLIAANEFVMLQSDYDALPNAPTNGDQVTISAAGVNNGSHFFSYSRSFTALSTNYIAIGTDTSTFDSTVASGSVQFQVQSGTQTSFVKSTAGVHSNMRGFTVPPTDVWLAHYRSQDHALAVAGTAPEESRVIRRLYEFVNTFAGSSGKISWSVGTANLLVLQTALQINCFNRENALTIAANSPTGISIPNNSVAYIVIPDADAAATVSLQVTAFGSGVLDRHGKNAFPLFWNIGGALYMRFAPFRMASSGETIIVGDQMSQEMLEYISDITTPVTSSPDPTNHNYSSTAGAALLQSDGLNTAIGKLDAAIASVGPAHKHIVYVSLQGNDTTGDGSFMKPFRTVVKANQFILAQAGDLPSATNIWSIWMDVGFYLETTAMTFLNFCNYYMPVTAAGMGGVAIPNTASPGQFLPITVNVSVGAQIGLYGVGTTADVTGGTGSALIINDTNTTGTNFEAVAIAFVQLAGLTVNGKGANLTAIVLDSTVIFDVLGNAINFKDAGVTVQRNSYLLGTTNVTDTLNTAGVGGASLTCIGSNIQAGFGPPTVVLTDSVLGDGTALNLYSSRAPNVRYTISGPKSTVVSDVASFPTLQSRFTYTNGASATTALVRQNEAYGLGYTPSQVNNWPYGEPTDVHAALETSGDAARTTLWPLKLHSDGSSTRLIVNGSDLPLTDGTTASKLDKQLLMTFAGAQVDFATGNIYASDGTTLLQTFVPTTITPGNWLWYSLTLITGSVGTDNRSTPQFVLLSGASDNASSDAAPRAAFASGGTPLGQVAVQAQNPGPGIHNVVQANIVQSFANGGGGGGAGNITDIQARLAIKLSDSRYELCTPADFLLDGKTLTDAASTAAFDSANSDYKFTAAGQKFISVNLLDANEFLTLSTDIAEAEVDLFYLLGKVDKAPIVELSRDGGNNYQAVTVNRIGTSDQFNGKLVFATEGSTSALQSNPIAGNNAFDDIATGSANSQMFTVASSETALSFQVQLDKTGAPLGILALQIVKDAFPISPGTPSLNPLDVLATTQVNIATDIAAGISTLTYNLSVTLPPGNYHMVLRPNAAYVNNGTNKLSIGVVSALPLGWAQSNQLSGGVWIGAVGTWGTVISGRILDLRLRVTSSATTNWDDPTQASLKGFGVSYYPAVTNIVTGSDMFEIQQVNGTSNISTFTLTKFRPDPRALKVYVRETGQVLVFGAFSLNGYQVVFPANTFSLANQTYTLQFEQVNGSYDNTDVNAALLAANHLGSTDLNIDRSLPGQGFFLRRPDGTLREIAINNNDELVVFSV